jgi:hypothetical protein
MEVVLLDRPEHFTDLLAQTSLIKQLPGSIQKLPVQIVDSSSVAQRV